MLVVSIKIDFRGAQTHVVLRADDEDKQDFLLQSFAGFLSSAPAYMTRTGFNNACVSIRGLQTLVKGSGCPGSSDSPVMFAQAQEEPLDRAKKSQLKEKIKSTRPCKLFPLIENFDSPFQNEEGETEEDLAAAAEISPSPPQARRSNSRARGLSNSLNRMLCTQSAGSSADRVHGWQPPRMLQSSLAHQQQVAERVVETAQRRVIDVGDIATSPSHSRSYLCRMLPQRWRLTAPASAPKISASRPTQQPGIAFPESPLMPGSGRGLVGDS
ncbi:unnamed protein product [Polarella glacialis]|uniref:Uncharacterized protein n=1 Tax=Polarella glacialis TaxID=89957 RepID=A0A813FSG3_POLGL|nr:unnamed protein product [Polarella glacialis]